MTSACPIWSRDLPARRAARRGCGRPPYLHEARQIRDPWNYPLSFALGDQREIWLLALGAAIVEAPFPSSLPRHEGGFQMKKPAWTISATRIDTSKTDSLPEETDLGIENATRVIEALEKDGFTIKVRSEIAERPQS
jgi:hypothetical protein